MMPSTTAYGPCPDCGAKLLFTTGLGPEGEEGAFELECTTCTWTMTVPEATKAASRIEAIREIVEKHSARRVEGYLVDAFTAQMLLKVYEALSPRARRKFGDPSLERLIDFGWKHVHPA